MKLIACFAALFAPCALALPLAAQAPVHILAEIEGRSRLILQDDTAQWQHFDLAAPGRAACESGLPDQPTVIDASNWWPSWADQPTCANRDCGGCTSDVLTGIAPALPNTDFEVLLTPIHARGPVSVVEYPAASNGYRVVLEFDDTGFTGADWYEVDLSVLACGSATRYCTSVPNSTGLPATIGLAGSLAVNSNDVHLLAFQCPPSGYGLFLYGSVQTQIPFADGNLCISPFFPGLHRAAPSLQLDASGAADVQLDLSALTAAPILPGSTWNFQFWFRDHAAGGSGSNLSDALSVTFCP